MRLSKLRSRAELRKAALVLILSFMLQLSIPVAFPVAFSSTETLQPSTSSLGFDYYGWATTQGWQKGNIGMWKEGEWVPYMLVIENNSDVSQPSPEMWLTYDHFDSGKNAIGFDNQMGWNWKDWTGTNNTDIPLDQGGILAPPDATFVVPGTTGPSLPSSSTEPVLATHFPAGYFTIPPKSGGNDGKLAIQWTSHLSVTAYWLVQTPSRYGSSFYPGASLHVPLYIPDYGNLDVPVPIPSIGSVLGAWDASKHAWRRIKGPWEDGTLFTAVMVDPVSPNVVYAGAGDGQGMFKSINFGESWAPINSGLKKYWFWRWSDYIAPTGIAISESNHRRIYVSSEAGVYRSDDMGETWKKVLYERAATVVVDPTNENIVYAGIASYGSINDLIMGAGGLMKSTDGGIKWTAADNGIGSNTDTGLKASILKLAISKANPQVLYATTDPFSTAEPKEVYKTTNGGQSWETINFSTEAVWNSVIKVVWYFIAGLSGHPTAEPPYQKYVPGFTGVVVSPASSDSIYVTTTDLGVLHSADGGTSWEPIGEGGLPLETSRGFLGLNESIAAVDHPQASLFENNLYVASRSGVYHFKNQDPCWNPMLDGLPQDPRISIGLGQALALAGSDRLYLATSDGLYTNYATEFPIFDWGGPLLAGAEISRPIAVAAGTKKITFSARIYGSSVSMKLLRPDGSVVGENTDASVEHFKEETYDVYTILNPMPGQWTVIVSGSDLPPDGEALYLHVSQVSETSETPVIDSTPPTTESSLKGDLGFGGWYKSDVSVTLSASDNISGSGLAYTEYSLDGGTNWLRYKGPFKISEEGTINLWYRSVDYHGNTETTREEVFKIDTSPPIITNLTIIHGYLYGTPLTISFSAVDDTSKTNDVSDSVTTNAWLNGRLVLNGQTISLNKLGTNTLVITAQDAAGNAKTIAESFQVGYAVKWQPPLKYLDSSSTETYAMTDGSTLPIKFTIADYLGNLLTDNSLRVVVTDGTNSVTFYPGTTDEAIRYDPTTSTYIVNLHTKNYLWMTVGPIYYINVYAGGSGVFPGYLQSTADFVLASGGVAKGKSP